MKALFIVVPILLIGGAVGAGFMGVINIPGITPKKPPVTKKDAAEKQPTDEGSATTDTIEGQQVTVDPGAQSTPTDPPDNVRPTEPDPKKADPSTDPEQGAKALAKYWDEIEIAKLIPITETYKEPELAQVLFYMQKAKVAELLSTVNSARAASLSRELQRLASVVKQEAP